MLWFLTRLFELTELSEVLLKTHMKTITNEECIAKAPENLKDVVYPSDICANGRDIDPITNLEGDGCGVKIITHQVGLKLIIHFLKLFLKG